MWNHAKGIKPPWQRLLAPLSPWEEGNQSPKPPLTQSRNCSPLCPPSPVGTQEKGLEGRNRPPLRNPILPRGEESIQGEALPPLYAPRPLIKLLQMDWPGETTMTPWIPTPGGPLC